MTFSALNVAVADLRRSLTSFVGPNALAEVTVRPPVDGNGEISFLRLVAWSYVLLFEAGRISIPFLLRSSGAYQGQQESMELIRALRTWSFHNLGLDSGRDLQLSRQVERWFLRACGQSPPDDRASWNACFDCICGLVGDVVQQCQRAVADVLSSDDDGKAVIKDLQHRIERSWAPRRFDTLVSDVATRLGVRVDVTKFRRSRLDAWRSFLLDLADDDDPAEAMGRLMERDLLEYVDGVLPISGKDIMVEFGIPSGPDVGSILRQARELFAVGTRDKDELMAAIRERLASNDRSDGCAVARSAADVEPS